MAILCKPKLLPLVALFLILLANKAHSQDTTSFAFDSFPAQPTDLIYQGDVFIPSNSTFAGLTRNPISGLPVRYSVGRVLYSYPVQFWDNGRQASFETTIRFIITPEGDNPPADGLTFFIAPVNSAIPSGSTGGNLGIFGSSGTRSSTFAVEFDTYINSPWDPNFRHIGIDINSRISRNATRADDIIGRAVIARINYEATTRRITVVAFNGMETYAVSYDFDLKTILPQQVQVGISASTGEGVAGHDIHGWYFTSTLVSDPQNNNAEAAKPYIQQYV